MGDDIKTLKILVIDDDHYQCKVIARMLKLLGINHVETDKSAETALGRLKMPHHHTIDIVICDLDMPDMDGIEFVRLLGEARDITCSIIVLSCKIPSILHSVELMGKEYRLNMLGVMEKPATIAAMREMLSRHLIQLQVKHNQRPEIMVDEIITALDAQEFEPFFQPKVDIQTRRVCGAEALVRWRHPEYGILPPGMFIDTIEKNNLMSELTWSIARQSAEYHRNWRNNGLDILMSINASLNVLIDTHFSNHLLDIVSDHNLESSHWIVEVTETIAMTDVARSLETLSRLRMKGFGLSIDDFGTGYSSLQQLTRVPYSELKIDQVFITGAAQQLSLQSVIESSVHLAKKLGLKTVGEGIETYEDWKCFAKAGGDIAQGYFCAKPMPGNDFCAWVDAWENEQFLTADENNSP